MKKVLIALLLILPLSSAIADKINNIVVADTSQSFADTASSIRKQMEVGGRFEYIKPTEKTAANNDLDNMTAMLQKSGSVAAMNASDKVKLLNMQEHLNGLLTHSDKERLVCERTNPMGSHIPTTTCRTYGDIERERISTQKFMDHTATNTPQLKRSN